jgi:hypothetical protein
VSEDILKHLERIAAMKSDLDRDKETMRRSATEIKRLRAINAELVAALKGLLRVVRGSRWPGRPHAEADAALDAIAKAEAVS